jgi:spore coat polysaccharide biosynthesis protein SpsF
MNIAIVIQARRGSTRLPDKVLLPLAGKPLLQRMVERVKQSHYADIVIVATTMKPEDDALVALCNEMNVHCYRGDEQDLLDRHYRAALEHHADVCVKIPSDCPLIDPQVIDQVIRYYLAFSKEYDFVSNLHPATWPDGQDVEVMPMEVLNTAWREASTRMQREHTTPFLWDQPQRFSIGNVRWKTGKDFSLTHRWTIDYVEDYLFIEAVYNELFKEGEPAFGVDAVLALLEQRPDIHAINQKYAGVNWYRNHLDELKTINHSMTKQLT